MLTILKNRRLPRYLVYFPVVFILCTMVSTQLDAQDNSSGRSGYRALPGDILQISVWKEPDLQLEVLIQPDSAFSIPLAGEISTHDRTVRELQQEITERLAKYISQPVVTVTVKEVLGNKVYVIGQVNDPGVFVVNPQVDVMQALSMAGGTTPFAALNEIRILRRSEGVLHMLEFRYGDIVKGRNLEQNIILQSGDTVVVP